MSIYFQKSFQRSFGTFPLKNNSLQSAINVAAEVGYRAFDTAQMYANEADTGEALAKLDISRSDLCITTKVHPSNYAEAAFLPSVEQSLKDLQVDNVDVLLLHWPPKDGDIVPSLKLLAKAKTAGLARNIGVSNYTAQMMRDATAIIDVPLITNQVEFHPLLNQDALLTAAADTGIPLSSYCSVARGKFSEIPDFAQIAARYEKTPAQIVLRWSLQKGVSINTMSTNPMNIKANFDIMNFTLSSVDMARIDALTTMNLRLIDKTISPWAPDWD